MQKPSQLLFTYRLLVAMTALCLVVAPFATTCCGRLSCEPTTSTDNSASPCHGAMTPHHRSVNCQTAPMCTDVSFALQLPRSNEVFRANVPQKPLFPIAVLAEITKVSGSLLLSDTHWPKSEDFVGRPHLAVSLIPLKL